MPLKFDTTINGQAVNCGTTSLLTNLNVGSCLCWTRFTTAVTGARFFQRGTANSRRLYQIGINNLTFLIGNVGPLQASADLANFSGYKLGIPICVGAVWNKSGANGDQKLYVGNLDSPLAEPSSYSTQVVGAGSPADDSASTFFALGLDILNPIDGLFWSFQIWNRVIALKDLQRYAQKYNPSRATLSYRPGSNGNGIVIDESGNNIHGTIVSGSTLPVPSNDYLPRVGL